MCDNFYKDGIKKSSQKTFYDFSQCCHFGNMSRHQTGNVGLSVFDADRQHGTSEEKSGERSYVKQFIKVEKQANPVRPRSGSYFIIAHLYLTSASLARQNMTDKSLIDDSKNSEVDSVQKQWK